MTDEESSAQLAVLMERAAQALAMAGLTVQDLIDDLPAARKEVVEEAYGAEFVQHLEQLQAEARRSE
jgi:hypothetical protein